MNIINIFMHNVIYIINYDINQYKISCWSSPIKYSSLLNKVTAFIIVRIILSH